MELLHQLLLLTDKREILSPETEFPRCDRCLQSALTILRKGNWELALCGHHTNRDLINLLLEDWSIVADIREFKIEEPEYKGKHRAAEPLGDDTDTEPPGPYFSGGPDQPPQTVG